MKTIAQNITPTDIKKAVKDALTELNIPSKTDINTLSKKIDTNQKALDQIEDVTKILRENEQNLKDLGGLKNRLDTLDKIMVTVDKIAGSIQTYQTEQALNSNSISNLTDRMEKVETHLNLPVTS